MLDSRTILKLFTIKNIQRAIISKISKVQNSFLKVCYVPATSTSLSRLLFLLLRWSLTVLMKQTRQAVCTFKQSILLKCLCIIRSKHWKNVLILFTLEEIKIKHWWGEKLEGRGEANLEGKESENPIKPRRLGGKREGDLTHFRNR